MDLAKQYVFKSNNIEIKLKRKAELNSNLLKQKGKNSIYILSDKFIVIDRSNKIVPIVNKKLTKKREKGEYFNSISWYFNQNDNNFYYKKSLYYFFEEIQEQGTILQTIVDELIPIDDTNMIQRVVLGTIMINFFSDNNLVKFDTAISALNNNFDKYKDEYFNKNYFKKIFMQIIEKNDIDLLNSFFDFNKECEVINKRNKNYQLKFNCSDLTLDLTPNDIKSIEKKFGTVTIYFEGKVKEQGNIAAFLGKKINNLFDNKEQLKEEEISEDNKSIFSKVKEVIEESTENMKNVFEDIENKILKFVDKLNIFKDGEEKGKTDIINRMNKLMGEKIERIKIDKGEVTIAGFDSAELQSDIEKKGEEYQINYRVTEEFLEVLRIVEKIIGKEYFNELLKEIVEHEKAENLYKIEFREQYQETYKGEEDIIEQGVRYKAWEYNLGRYAHEFAMETAGEIQRKISEKFENINGLINLEKRLAKKGNSLTTKEAEEIKNIILEILTDMSEYGVNIEKIYKTFPNIKEEIIAKYNGETAGKDISEATKEQSIGKKICAIPIKILKDKEGKILKDEKGKDIQVKVSIRYNEKEKTLQMSYIGKSKETIEKYIAEGVITREDIEKVAEVLFIDRLMTDFIVREKYEKYSGEKIDRYNEGLIEEQKAMLKEIGYSDLEINELLSYATTTNTYVGIKDATLTISKSIKDIGNILLVYKRAGVSKVVLVKGEGIQEFDEKVINQISKAGLHPIIGITKDSTKREIEKYEKIKSVYGYRALISKEYNQEQIKETVEKIKNSKKEISYKMEDNKAIAEIDKMLNAKAICVLDTKNMGVSKNKELIISGEEINANTKEFIKAIAEQGRVSLYFDSDGDENIEKANKLVEKIFGKGLNSAKTMISLGKTYINSQFGQLLKKNVATIYFSKGYEKGYEELFEDKTADKVAQSLNKLLSGEKTYDSFKKEYEQGNYNEIMTNEFKEEILNVEKQEKFSKEEKAVVIRQMVIGSMVSYVEKRIISKYCDINTTDIKVKNQIADRILSLICNGYNIEDIEKELTKEEITINDKLSELVREILNGERAKDISERWNKTDVRLKVYADNNVIEDIKEIRILLEDNLKPIDREENRIAENVLDVTKMLLQAA